ncbi:Cobyric acid synthase 1, partial [human gut metagenome]
KLDIAVIRLSHMSNFTDFTMLDRICGVNVRYVREPEELKNPDIIIIPGTKNTIDDLRAIKENKALPLVQESLLFLLVVFFLLQTFFYCL